MVRHHKQCTAGQRLASERQPRGPLLAVGLLLGGLLWSGPTLAVSTVTSTTSYDYDTATGLLRKTVVEPGNSSLCLVTEITQHDAYGHPQTTNVRNCNGAAATAPGAVTEAPAPTGQALFSTQVTNIRYSSDHRFPQTTTNVLNQTETRTYNAGFGEVLTDQTPDHLIESVTYDALGRKTLEKHTDGTGVKWDYLFCRSHPAPVGVATAECASVPGDTSISNGVINPVYYVQTTPVKSDGVTPIGAYKRVYYDALNREIRTEVQGFDASTVGTLVYVDTQYNNLGLVGAKSAPYYSDAAPAWTKFQYDALGRVTQVVEPSAAGTSTTKTSYSGLSTTVTDPRNHQTVQTKNAAGLLMTTTDAKGSLTRSYDPLGNLAQTVDQLGNVVSMVYDVRGRKTALYDPDLGVWSYAYDAAGHLVQQIDGKKQTTTLEYDAVGRLAHRNELDLKSSWYYDTNADGSACGTTGVGELCEETSDNGFDRKFVYDSAGRAGTTTTTFGTTSYQTSNSYDAVTGRLSSQTYPTGIQTSRVYTTFGYLWKVVDARTSANLWVANSRDAAGSLLQYTYGNGVSTIATYYVDGRLHTTVAGTSGSVQNLSFGYDEARNITSRFDVATGVTSSYAYDELNRLLSETRSGGALTSAQTMSWTYDTIGNIATRTESGTISTYYYNTSGAGSSRPHAVGSVDGWVSGLAAPNYTYDPNGNLLTGASRSVTWTSANMTQSIVESGANLAFWYGPDHDRIQEQYTANGSVQRTTVYLNDADGLFYEEDRGASGSQKKHYVSVEGHTVAVILCAASPCTTVANTTTEYWHEDNLGSVSVVTDANGSVMERMAYEPFGKRRNADGASDTYGNLQPSTTHRGFTEQEHLDEVGLINLNGRVYDPGLGRFMSPDPTVPYPMATQSYNRFSYTRNNPVRAIDPSGFDDQDSQTGGASSGSFTYGGSTSTGDSPYGISWGTSANPYGSYSYLSGDLSQTGAGSYNDPMAALAFSPPATNLTAAPAEPELDENGEPIQRVEITAPRPTVALAVAAPAVMQFSAAPRVGTAALDGLGLFGEGAAEAASGPVGWALGALTAGWLIYDHMHQQDNADALNSGVGANSAAGGASPPPDGDNNDNNKKSKDDQPASEKTAKDIAKRIERDLGKDARRDFHDAKERGAGDRTLEQLKQDARDLYMEAGKAVPSWLK